MEKTIAKTPTNRATVFCEFEYDMFLAISFPLEIMKFATLSPGVRYCQFKLLLIYFSKNRFK